MRSGCLVTVQAALLLCRRRSAAVRRQPPARENKSLGRQEMRPITILPPWPCVQVSTRIPPWSSAAPLVATPRRMLGGKLVHLTPIPQKPASPFPSSVCVQAAEISRRQRISQTTRISRLLQRFCIELIKRIQTTNTDPALGHLT
ncbi:hypothetical protein QBC43DRAFT_135155 [Cladorrhinum sp. PSN259]|nr:hypothetical protein QBC43DRAFT_135155 [Cladorrhinum sp. PSN259]